MLESLGAVVEAAGAPPVVQPIAWDDLVHDEVLVQVVATGICHTDLSCASGRLPIGYPVVLGHEAAGVVEAVGPAVQGFQPGARVVVSVAHHCGRCRYCEAGRPALCVARFATRSRLFRNGVPLNQAFGTGTFASRIVVRERSLVSVPDAVPLSVAAVTGCAVVTGLGAVLNDAALGAGQTAAVFGCGGVGLSAVMGARLSGAARVTAVDVDASRGEIALAAGATELSSPVADELREIEPAGFDVIIETSGNLAAMQLALQVAAPMATIVLVGLPPPEVSLPVPVQQFAGRTQRLVGCNMGGLRPNVDFPRYFRLYAQGQLPLDLLCGTSIPLREAALGFRMAERRESVRVLLAPADADVG